MSSARGHPEISLNALPGIAFAVIIALAVTVFGDTSCLSTILENAVPTQAAPGPAGWDRKPETSGDLSRLVDEVMKRDPTAASTASERTYALADTNQDGELSDEERSRLVQEVLATSRDAAADGRDDISDDEFASIMNELLTEYEQSNPRAVQKQRPEWDSRTGWGRKYSPLGTASSDSSEFGDDERKKLVDEVIADVKAKHDSAMGWKRTHALADSNGDGELSEEERTRLVQEVLTTRETAADGPNGDVSDDDFTNIMNELLSEYEQSNPRAVREERPEWDTKSGWGRKYEM